MIDFNKPLKMRVHGEPITLSVETIQLTCEWYAKNAQDCINEVLSGEVFVNDIDQYCNDKKADIKKYLTGDFDIWLGFYQQAYFIQTNKSVSIL